MKILIFDASTLISLAMNGLFDELRELKKKFDGKFIITKEVYYEVVERPINVKRFELEALEMKELVKEGVFEMPEKIGVDNKIISEKTKEILDFANSILIAEGQKIHLIDLGEASCLALAQILDDKKIQNLIAIDERTTRMLCEKPENLIELLERKMHTKIKISDKSVLKEIKQCKVIRSAELVYIMWKKGIVKIKDPLALNALLYSVKFKGCSISDDEIKEIKRIR